MSLLKFPEELLDSICRELSCEHPLPVYWVPQLRITRSSPALRSPSLVDRRLRRICLPLSFAYLFIEDLAGFAKFCFANPVCLQFARMLTFGISFYRGWDKTLRRLLPSFRKLTCIDLGGQSRLFTPDLFQFILELPTVSTVILREMATESSEISFSDQYCDIISFDWDALTSKVDVSKVVLVDLYLDLFHPQREFPSDGMKIIALNISDPEELDEGFGSRIFNGLYELALQLQAQPVSFTWLPTFIAAHPHLHEIRLSDPERSSHVPSSISPFFNEVDRLGLQQHLKITSLYLSRVKAELQSAQQWHVAQVSLKARNSRLLEILSLLSSSFPSIKNFSINLEKHRSIYSLDDIIAAFSHFHFVQNLRFEHIFHCLEFGDELEYDRHSISEDMEDYDLRV
ncbi:hypothetical protein GYMLUDRAFT_82966 [Collybiopsis luxurians FD-317 M1]|nr:hypothetical protein GYMLUDRAFT_82966 [Collybiopsis luxurians FD-317 M1]